MLFILLQFTLQMPRSGTRMIFVLILSSLLTIQAGVLVDEANCSGIKINGQYYNEEILMQDLDRPYSLAVDYSPNILYFSYNIKGSSDDESRSARLNLITKEFSNIEGINNGFAQTVDQKTHEVYIGGSDGIYKYDYATNKAELYAQKGSNIWHLYFNQHLYFSIFPTQVLYVLRDGNPSRFEYLEDTKVDHFVIDNENDIFFTNATGLYSVKAESKNATLYVENPVVRSLTTDKNGNVYLCLQDGVYAVRKSTQSLEKIYSIDDGFGLAFDNENNIVYADAIKVVRLKLDLKNKCNS